VILCSTAINEATFTWSGQLPPRHYQNPIYSCKVFLGGVPWDITEGKRIIFFFPPRIKQHNCSTCFKHQIGIGIISKGEKIIIIKNLKKSKLSGTVNMAFL